MRVQCPICAELFERGSDVSATYCGHLFHNFCLEQWRERSRTCPQCRTNLGRRDVIAKLYFNFGQDEEGNNELEAWENLTNDLGAKLHDVEYENTKLKDVISVKDEIIRITECDLRTATGINNERAKTVKLQESQIQFLTKENIRLHDVESELVTVKKELQNYDYMKSLIDGNAQETDRILEAHATDPTSIRSLATYCALLKREFHISNASKGRLKEEVAQLKKMLFENNSEMLKQNMQLTEQEKENKTMGESLLLAERELTSLRKENDKMHKALQELRVAQNTPFDRCIALSPALNVMAIHGETVIESSKTTNEATKKPAAEPVMKIGNENLQSRSVAPSLTRCHSIGILQKCTLLQKRKPTKNFDSRERGYDGLGGHTRPDVYPSGLRAYKKTRLN